MLSVITADAALKMMLDRFSRRTESETVELAQAEGRALVRAELSDEFVPGFDRATMDGYAVRAADTFGCSEALPAILTNAGCIAMGETSAHMLCAGECMEISTGGALCIGADAVVMREHSEDFQDGTVGISRPVPQWGNVIKRGEDGRPGDIIASAGRRLAPQDIGALAAFGRTRVSVYKKPVVCVISTGDELVSAEEQPGAGQIRDVNMHMLLSLLHSRGCEARSLGILKDDALLLDSAVKSAISECDCLLISGGTSAGMKDACESVLSGRGELLFHGLALKPGKPTVAADVCGKPVFGLPGNPVAAWFVTRLLVLPLTDAMQGVPSEPVTVRARLTEALSSNHGREECVGVFLKKTAEGLRAVPTHAKSGLIATMAGTDGYIRIPGGCEGLCEGAAVEVILY